MLGLVQIIHTNLIIIISSVDYIHGSHGSGKPGKVWEFDMGASRAGKSPAFH